MQNQLSEIVTGNRRGINVSATMYDVDNVPVSIAKYRFTDKECTGIKLQALHNIPDGVKLSVTKIDTKSGKTSFEELTYDSTYPFDVYKIDDEVDCFVVSGKFKPTHNYKSL